MTQRSLDDVKRLLDEGQLAAAEARLQSLIATSHLQAEAAFLLGIVYARQARHRDAIEAYNRSLSVAQQVDAVWNNLGASHRAIGENELALKAFRRAIELNPRSAEAHSNLGGLLHEAGEFSDALQELRLAITLAPDLSEPRGSLGLALLLRGEFREGWQLYEQRLVLRGRHTQAPPFPAWRGQPLDGAFVFLRCEQGFGDSIQFIRYAPMVAARSARVIVGGPPELRRLLATAPGVEQVVVPGDLLPQCAAQCPLMSLPRLFNTVIETIPCVSSYLSANSNAVKAWGDRVRTALTPVAGIAFKRVGLVWAGASHNKHDRHRSVRLSRWSRVTQVEGVRLFSLQIGAAADQLISSGIPVVDWTSELHDFADTAALISNLDLVITVDTAVAHLAGALGKPVWVLIHYSPDWRWLLGRSDSPWYPSMRLFRQPTPGDWDTAISDIERALREFVLAPSDNPA